MERLNKGFKFLCLSKDLDLERTLFGGQSFRREVESLTAATQGFTKKENIKLEDGNDFEAIRMEKSINIKEEPNIEGDKDLNFLKSYFQLNVDINELFNVWSNADLNFRMKSQNFKGIRVLDQHPVENTFSFICSSNNNISRITLMISKMAKKYGKFIGKFNDVEFFSFPEIQDLAKDVVEDELRELGFGYRAKYIFKSAKFLMNNGGEDFLYNIKKLPYFEAKVELLKLTGVGPKVADCILLMSLGKTEAIPIDCHVWQIVTRDYNFKSKSKSLSSATYLEIFEMFYKIFGVYAGWAQNILFCADLRQFKEKKSKRTLSELELDEIETKKNIDDKVPLENSIIKNEEIEDLENIKMEDAKKENDIISYSVKLESIKKINNKKSQKRRLKIDVDLNLIIKKEKRKCRTNS
ncbi:8-oxoguanine glycosylase ogg1 [Lobulomyces angularis]|nr:8-oxoguanine glycosylase ogg1 [Lobulomyces angularis]